MNRETLASEGYFHAGIAVPDISGHPNKPWLDAKQEELKKLGIKCKIVLEGGCNVLYCEQRYFDYKEAMEAKRWLDEVLTWEEEFALKEYNQKLADLKKIADQRRQTLDKARAAGLKI